MVQAYDEEAFRYLLEIEGTRSERTGCSFLLLLVDLKAPRGGNGCLAPKLAAKLLSTLLLCVRETDFVGWFREGYVAGVVLTALDGRSPTHISSLVSQRVRAELREGLPSDVAPRLRVRLYHYPELDQIESRCDLESVP